MFLSNIYKKCSTYTTKQWLLCIVLISGFACVAYSFAYRIELAVDARAYDSIAQNIVAGHGFVEDSSVPIEFDRSIQRAGPAYEYFLAGIYAVFGHHLEVVWILQALIHACSVLLVFYITRFMFTKVRDERIGLVAAALFGFHPDLIEISAMVMTETFYLFVMLMAVYAFMRVYQTDRSRAWAVILGTALALGVLSRPPIVLFIPIIAVFYVLRRRFTQLLLMLFVTILCLTPWIVRNYKVYDQFILTTVIGEYNIWIGNTVEADGGQLGGGYNPFDEYVAQHGYTTVSTAAKDSFKTFLVDHPDRFVELTAIRFVRYMSLIRPMGFWFYQSGIPQLVFIGFSTFGIAVLFSLGFIGMTLLAKEKKQLYWYMIAFALTSPLVLLPTVVQSRYRFQIYPFLAIFGAYTVWYLVEHKGAWKKPLVWAPVLVLLLFSLVDIFMNGALILERISLFL